LIMDKGFGFIQGERGELFFRSGWRHHRRVARRPKGRV
jgi:hypothetical protein